MFLLTLFDQLSAAADANVAVTPPCRDPLRELADLLVRTAKEYLKAVEDARHIGRGCSREETGDFPTAVDDTISLEHKIDHAHRRCRPTAAEIAVPS